MEDEILEKTREAIEGHLQMIIRKNSNMTPMDIEIITKDICALEALKRIENGGSEGYSEESSGNSSNSYRRGRSRSTGRYMSRDSYPDEGGTDRYYDSGSNSSRSYDGGSGNSGYSGHSIQDRMVDKLERMVDEAQTENERKTVREWIQRLKH